MNIEKRCTKCNTTFSGKKRYCPKCGAYWRRSQVGGWTGDILDAERRQAEKKPQKRYGILCGSCRQIIEIEDSNYPDFCPYCSQMIGIDPIKVELDKDGNVPIKDNVEEITPLNEVNRKSPFKKRTIDNSIISLICLSHGYEKRLELEDSVEYFIIGKKGNCHQEFFATSAFAKIGDKHVEVFHESTGWYVRALTENTLCNGKTVEIGEHIKLSNGDFLDLGDCSLAVEIRGRE